MPQVLQLSKNQQAKFYMLKNLKGAYVPIKAFNDRIVSFVCGDKLYTWLTFTKLEHIFDECAVCINPLNMPADYYSADMEGDARFKTITHRNCSHSLHLGCFLATLEGTSQEYTKKCFSCETPLNVDSSIISDNPIEAFENIMEDGEITLDQLRELSVTEAVITSIPQLKQKSSEKLAKLTDMNNPETKKAVEEELAQQKKSDQDKTNLECEKLATIQSTQDEKYKKNTAEADDPSDATKNKPPKYYVSKVKPNDFFAIIQANYTELKKALNENHEVYEELYNMCKNESIFRQYDIERIESASNVSEQIDIFVEHIRKPFMTDGYPISTACRVILMFLLTNNTLINRISNFKVDDDFTPKTTDIAKDAQSWNAEKVKQYDVSGILDRDFFEIIRKNHRYLCKNLLTYPEVFENLIDKCNENDLISKGRIKAITGDKDSTKHADAFVSAIERPFPTNKNKNHNIACREMLTFLLENQLLKNNISEEKKENGEIKVSYREKDPELSPEQKLAKDREIAEKRAKMEADVLSAINPKYTVPTITPKDFKEVIRTNLTGLRNQLMENRDVYRELIDDCVGKYLMKDVYLSEIKSKGNFRDQVRDFLNKLHSHFITGGIPNNIAYSYFITFLLDKGMLVKNISKQEDDGKLTIRFVDPLKIETSTKTAERNIAEESKSWDAEKTKKTDYDASSSQDTQPEVKTTTQPEVKKPAAPAPQPKEDFKRADFNFKNQYILGENIEKVKDFYDIMKDSRSQLQAKFIKNPKILEYVLQLLIKNEMIDADYIEQLKQSNDFKIKIDSFINYFSGERDTKVSRSISCWTLLKILVSMELPLSNITTEKQDNGTYRILYKKPQPEVKKPAAAPQPKEDFKKADFNFKNKYILGENIENVKDFYDIMKDSRSQLQAKFIKNPKIFEYVLQLLIKNEMIDADYIEQLKQYNDLKIQIDSFINYFSEDRDTKVARDLSCLTLLEILVSMELPLNNITTEKQDKGMCLILYKKPQPEVKTITQPKINKPEPAPQPKKDLTRGSYDFEDKYTPAEHFAMKDFHGIIQANYTDLKKTLIENEDLFEYILNKCVEKGILDNDYKNQLSGLSAENQVINFINYFVILPAIKFNHENPCCFILKLLVDMKLLSTKVVKKEKNNGKIEICFVDNKPVATTTPKPAASNIAQSIKTAEAKKPSVQENNIFKEDKYVVSENITFEDFYSVMKNSYNELKKELTTNSDIFKLILHKSVEKEFIDKNHAEKMYSKNTETNVNLFLNYFNQSQKIKANSKVTCLPKMCGTKTGSSELHLPLHNAKTHRAVACSFVLKILVDKNILVNNIIKQEKANGKIEISFTRNRNN